MHNSKVKNNIFRNKKVLVMGLGLHGGGVAVTNYFIKQGAKIRVTDLKDKDQLLLSINKVRSGKIKYTLGGHKSKDFLWADIVVQNPGVPKESRFLKVARDHGAQIENEATLFFKIIGRERIIGITGTRGKSTTTTLIYKLIKEKYPDALIGGNIATSPMFLIVDKAKKTKAPIVLELSSWHLENLGEQQLSPHLAVFTNLYPDHLNRYKDLNEYGRAKQNIFEHQRIDDYVILNWDNFYTLSLSKNARSNIFWFSKEKNNQIQGCFIKDGFVMFNSSDKEEKVALVKDIRLAGEHNLENVLAAVCAAKILKLPNELIVKVIKNFQGLEHRLEKIGKFNGIIYINDTAATTPDGALVALKTLAGRNIILIAGGSDKGIPQEKFDELGESIQKYCKAVILFSGAGSEKIKKSLELRAYSLELIADVKSMSDAIGIAQSQAHRGDTVLLSPACASFGLFSNEFDRGNQFKGLVGDLK